MSDDTQIGVFDDAIPDLRRARRKRRTADLEWFDLAYRVYLVALGGGGLVLWLSNLIQDDPVSASGLDDVTSHGPAVGGLIAAIAILLGLRSGSRGGPLAIEEAEVRHVLMAPISRERALLRPTLQRARTLLGAGLIVGALIGELFGRRMPGPLAEWTIAGAAAGLLVAGAYTAAAILAHALGLAEWQAGVSGALLVALEAAAVSHQIPAGPFDTIGSLALWPLRVEAVDLVAAVVVFAALITAFVLIGRFDLEAMSRRSALVAQLRFAVTMQDVRTVMLLRRQLSLEQTREQPWFRLGARGPAVWRRSVRSLARFPAKRLGRLALLSAGAGAAQLAVFRGTTAMFLVSALCCFVIGLETLEPLAQELDHPDYSESFPIDPGKLHQLLLLAPGVLLVVSVVPGVLTAFAMRPQASTLGIGLLLAVPAALVGGAGAVLNTISGAPDPYQADREGAFVPPEFAGAHLAFKSVRPLLVAALGSLPVVLLRSGIENGYDATAVALRSLIGGLILVTLVVWWVERRLAIKRWWRGILAENKAQRTTTGAPR